MSELLRVESLQLDFVGEGSSRRILHGISFRLEREDTLGIVGESGSGKTATLLSVLRLLPTPPARYSGNIEFEGRAVFGYSPGEMRALRGSGIAMIFQDTSLALNPVFRVGDQIVENILRHEALSRRTARLKALEHLEKVGLGAPEQFYRRYPHELSGGMRQRVMIALALSGGPKLLLADEPTSALDTRTKAEILAEIARVREAHAMSILMISHDVRDIGRTCRRVMVMYRGRIVEAGPTEDILARPHHPYSKLLVESAPSLTKPPRLVSIREDVGAEDTEGHRGSGCAFAHLCPRKQAQCEETEPPMETHGARSFACFFPEEGK